MKDFVGLVGDLALAPSSFFAVNPSCSDVIAVLHAVRKVEGMLQEDDKLAQELELLKRLISENN